MHKLSDFDICWCGDYRLNHSDGTGPCKMPNDLSHGYQPCNVFQLHEQAVVIPEWAVEDK